MLWVAPVLGIAGLPNRGVEADGGLGYLRDGQVENEVRDALASRIYSGTSEIQRSIVSRGLGL